MDIIFKSQPFLIIFTILISVLGGYLFLKLRIPAGPLLGALIFTMILSIFKGGLHVPEYMVIISRIITGVLIGCRCSREIILSLKKVFFHILFFTFFMISLSICSGFLISSITGINKMTAVFGSAPGGIIDMSLISSEFGADMSIVALIQTLRVIANITIIPLVVRKFESNTLDSKNKKIVNEQMERLNNIPCKDNDFRNKTTRFLVTIIVGIIGGLLGIALSIPAGAMIGSFIFVAIFNAFLYKLFIPIKMKYGIQILVGAVIGLGVTMDNILDLKKIIAPALMAVSLLLAIGILLGLSLNKIWKIDLITALLASAPGGLTSMSLIALDLGADISFVTSLQFMRLVAIMIFYPFIMRLTI